MLFDLNFDEFLQFLIGFTIIIGVVVAGELIMPRAVRVLLELLLVHILPYVKYKYKYQIKLRLGC